eukprot:scaffold107003_cov51-Phaeocystis_antarctica.AAC.2
MSKTTPVWPASAAQATDWPRLADAWGGLERDLGLKEASGEPAGRSLSHLVFDIGSHAWCQAHLVRVRVRVRVRARVRVRVRARVVPGALLAASAREADVAAAAALRAEPVAPG